MANDIAAVSDILIAGAHLVLREQATTARRVTTEYQPMAAERNKQIDVPIASPKTAKAIGTPSAPPTPDDFAPTTVPVVLDQWFMSSFQLTDREQLELKPGIFPAEAEEALKALINKVDVDILSTSLDTPYYAVQTATVAWVDIPLLHKVLFENLSPMSDLSCFIDGTSQAQLLSLQEFIHLDKSGETAGLRQASLGTRMGIDWFANQNTISHTNGDRATALVNGAGVKGDTTFEQDGGTLEFQVGDIINLPGSGDHAITDRGTNGQAGSTITIRPALRAAVNDNAAITYPSDIPASDVYVVNYAFHRRAIAFASRPLASISSPSTEIRVAADPLSGIAVRLEVRRIGKVTSFEWDILYGVKLIRPELTARWVDTS